jgi:acyl-CoA synthetase (NDP forming)
LVAVARDHWMLVLGPDSVGVANNDPAVSLNTTPGPTPGRGTVALLSQSGAVGMLGLAEARRSGAGVSSFVSLGNSADVSTDDLLEYWEDDEATVVICLHLESFGNPRRFARLARRISPTKPIVVLKSGHAGVRRPSAAKATRSASVDEAVDALLTGAGVIRVRTLTELFDTAFVVARQPLPAGRRVAIVSTSRGAGLAAADACEQLGLDVAELSPTTAGRLCRLLPSPRAGTNPVDVAVVPAEQLEVVLDAVLADPGVDAAIVVSAPPNDGDRHLTADAVASAAGRSTKPVLGCALSSDAQPSILPDLGRSCVPWFPYPERAAAALAHAAAYWSWRDRPPEAPVALGGIDHGRAADVVAKVLAAAPHGRRLQATEIAELLSAYGVKMARGDDPELGGRPELTLAVSVINDPSFGPLLSAGLGGDPGQLVSGRAHCSIPMTRSKAAELARAIPGGGAIAGSLRPASADPVALEDAILRIARLAEDIPELAELALRPLIAPPSGVVVQAADGRVSPRARPEPWLRHLP